MDESFKASQSMGSDESNQSIKRAKLYLEQPDAELKDEFFETKEAFCLSWKS